ncbi:hypothetical protein chiPu_0001916 [Chiloscyllium punctatum]|uniref:Uncharacterized protein n=1 Tax=Chiloscyllium punctatum TaxID=137246 RepID=A0A401RZK6_CHIPU|nr:hypothetical protein [Chiloscyllium punctatum]
MTRHMQALGYLEIVPASLTRDAQCATGTVKSTVSQKTLVTMVSIEKMKLRPDQGESTALSENSHKIPSAGAPLTTFSDSLSVLSLGKVDGVIIIVAVIIILLLCFLLGMHIALWRKNMKKRNKLLSASWYRNVQTEDTWSTHLPEQECGELSHQERKKVDEIYVSVNSAC